MKRDNLFNCAVKRNYARFEIMNDERPTKIKEGERQAHRCFRPLARALGPALRRRRRRRGCARPFAHLSAGVIEYIPLECPIDMQGASRIDIGGGGEGGDGVRSQSYTPASTSVERLNTYPRQNRNFLFRNNFSAYGQSQSCEASAAAWSPALP